ncbi:MAG: hypothetical protein QXV60_02185 [Nitrososphaerota archaeon]
MDLLKRYILSEGVSSHHIEVYDHWIFHHASKDVQLRTLDFHNNSFIFFENLRILPPSYVYNGRTLPLTPKLARERSITYGNDWYVDVVLKERLPNGSYREIERRDSICIGLIPLMLKSRNCYLHGKSPEELIMLGEDPMDPGGYFIVCGTEKVVLLQEQLALNRIFLMNIDTKGSVVVRMTVNTPKGTALNELALDKTGTIIKFRFPSIYSNKVGKKYRSINVLCIYRLLGFSNQEEIINIIKLFIKPCYVSKSLLKLSRNLVDFNLFTDDVDALINKMNKNHLNKEERIKEVKTLLFNDLFPHVNNLHGPDGETIQQRETRITMHKIYLLSIMVARFLEYLAGYRPLDNRDSWSNKRAEGAGRLMQQLFRNAWRKTLNNIQSAIDNKSIYNLNGVVEKMKYSIVTDTFRDSFVTTNWGVKGSQMKTNITQILVRDSIIATLSHINTVDVSISRTDRQANLRMVQNDQWGYICPVSTPEGENAGIVKSLAITAKVSLERSDHEIIRFLIGDDGMEIVPKVSLNPNFNKEWTCKTIVNGKFIGWCHGCNTKEFLIGLRRSGVLPYDMSVILEEDWLYVDTSPSRLIRPLLVVDSDQQLIIDKLGLHNQPIHVLLSSGALEYISAWEQEYIKIAPTKDDIIKRIQRVKESAIYTHCELDPIAILGPAASLIPWLNHNQAPRNTYQVSMGKQALGLYHTNHMNRFDGKTKILVFPNHPVVTSKMLEIFGLDFRASGENITIAFMAFPFTEEDSFIVKKEFLENGGFRIIKYITYKTTVRHSGDVIETLAKPELRYGESPSKYQYIQMYDPGDPRNGLPMIGAPLRQGDCVIGKVQYIASTKEKRNDSVMLRVGDEGIVDKVLVTTDNKTTIVLVKLRTMRVPQEGDKFAPRNAQKGTIGLVISEADLPFTSEGITPDFIINTHCIPSRMTMEYPMELLASKYAAMKGQWIDASAFSPFNIEKYRAGMIEYNMNEFGYEKMYSGTTGKELETTIFFGPMFFQALKHHVKDKIQSRNTGQIKPMTRQPPKGRGNRGGLRFGEMERDAVISHGASAFLRERLMFASDGYEAAFCKNCGTFAVNNPFTNDYKPCKLCGNKEFGRYVIPYAYKLLIHLLGSVGINLHPEFYTPDEYINKVFNRALTPCEKDNSIGDNTESQTDEDLESEDVNGEESFD